MPLVLYSKATEKIVATSYPDCDYKMVSGAPSLGTVTVQRTYNDVIAIGGGSVIDTAKILCRKRITAIPTTFSGASETNHAVYWFNKTKLSLKTPFPFTVIIPEYLSTLNGDTYQDTLADCIAHTIESKYSKHRTHQSSKNSFIAENILLSNPDKSHILTASLLAGNAIQTTGTNLIHALSYPLTGIYNIQHGRALRYLLNKIGYLYPTQLPTLLSTVQLAEKIDWQLVLTEAQRYPKYYQSEYNFTDQQLLEALT